jgi:hypothetical protein
MKTIGFVFVSHEAMLGWFSLGNVMKISDSCSWGHNQALLHTTLSLRVDWSYANEVIR